MPITGAASRPEASAWRLRGIGVIGCRQGVGMDRLAVAAVADMGVQQRREALQERQPKDEGEWGGALHCNAIDWADAVRFSNRNTPRLTQINPARSRTGTEHRRTSARRGVSFKARRIGLLP
ncbi:MAG: hypothetical protein MZW92_42730 [Comamonadaceae bacterium]|nr:hypothetical protein [Comamonadaceae bacterium]